MPVGGGVFLTILTSKAEGAGRTGIAVDPRNTSRTCPECGHVSAENRPTQEKFHCVSCGDQAHAEVVGALNVLRAGLAPRNANPAQREAPSSSRGRSHLPARSGGCQSRRGGLSPTGPARPGRRCGFRRRAGGRERPRQRPSLHRGRCGQRRHGARHAGARPRLLRDRVRGERSGHRAHGCADARS
ncbi:zinc ribbon domain-containing protein [Streptomyces vinaceus]|uniref:zinc ribbon domain-containing protein n=1 Tax=Streptomyces vinaceus TaxID=1960 RepID=UPI00369EE9D5